VGIESKNKIISGGIMKKIKIITKNKITITTHTKIHVKNKDAKHMQRKQSSNK